MKTWIVLALALLLNLPALGGKLPALNQFFKEETVVKTYTIAGTKAKLLTTAKDFDTLNEELKKTLGEGWVPEAPKPIKDPKRRKMVEATGFDPDASVIYVTPQNPKLRVTFYLTKKQGVKEGQSVAILMLSRDFQGK